MSFADAGTHYFFFFGNAALGSFRRTSRRTRRASATAFRAAVKEMSGPDKGYRVTLAYLVS